ncbi:hypothetical protein BH10ACI3_BH10ACI3_25500 [soil metagenome]
MLHLVAVSEILAFAGASTSTFYLAWQRSKVQKWLTIIPRQDDRDVLRLQSQYGYNEHSFVGISVQPEVWIDKANNGAVSYNENGKVWVVAGEPLGREEDLPEITRQFLKFARTKKKIVAFLPATEKFARSVASADARIVKVGAAPYFDLQNWEPRGNSAKKLRLGVNHGRKAGVTVTEVSQVTDQFRREANKLSNQWAESRRAGVNFGWIFELVPFQNSESRKYFAARDLSGNLVGLLAASPIPAREGWYLEDVLRSSDAPNGTSDLLVFEALGTLAAQGAKLATLGTVPLSDKGADDLSSGQSFLTETALKLSRRHLNSVYNFEGLGTFKSKFVPTWWESEYAIVSKGRLIPPRVANAMFNIIIPGGLLQLLQILFFDQAS